MAVTARSTRRPPWEWRTVTDAALALHEAGVVSVLLGVGSRLWLALSLPN